MGNAKLEVGREGGWGMDGREEGGTAEDEKQQFVPPQSNKL